MARRRPLYETAADLNNEASATAVLCEALGCDALKLPLASRADRLLHKDGEARTIVEYKCRRVKRGAYDTFMISKAKYDALCAWNDRGFKAALLVEWADQLAYLMVPCEHEDGEGGRTDRGDERDIESMVFIPTALFNTVKRK
jgi:hypothetical protein